jgi:MATE family multidrug resistance protein
MFSLKSRWRASGGYGDVLRIAFPLILSSGSNSIQQFVDRMFLTWYSPESIAAAMPAGLLSFTIMSLFVGTASYVSTFVAQYYGAKRDSEIGKAVWQAIYFSIGATVIILMFVPLAETIFRITGHAESIQRLEVNYFRIMCYAGFITVGSAALSGFFNGTGKTWVIMWSHFLITVINIVLDYGMIFGNFGLPEMGIEGAAIATNIASGAGLIVLIVVIFRPKTSQRFGILDRRNRKFDPAMFKRLLRFGLPSGLQFFLDLLGFSLFLMIIGRIGIIELAASNIAFNINTLAFMPMMGLGVATSILVGQNLGADNPKKARFCAYSATHISFTYMLIIALCYVLVPQLFLMPFGAQSDPESFQAIYDYGIILLRFIALYSIFDTLNIVFSNALKGAGDTRFVMIVLIVLSWTLMVIPAFLIIVVFKWHWFIAWGFATTFVASCGIVFWIRFLKGKWETMRVIET